MRDIPVRPAKPQPAARTWAQPAIISVAMLLVLAATLTFFAVRGRELLPTGTPHRAAGPDIVAVSARPAGVQAVDAEFTVDGHGRDVTCQLLVGGVVRRAGQCRGHRIVTVDGLGADRSYRVQVIARSTDGASAISGAVPVRTRPAPRVSVARGEPFSGPGCWTACARLRVRLTGFAPSTRYTVTCEAAGTPFRTYRVRTDERGRSTSAVCRFGRSGQSVRVAVGPTRSTALAW